MKVIRFIKNEIEDYSVLLSNIPPVLLSMFILSVVLMNFLANKELLSYKYMALDCGYLLSWFAFLAMDMMCRRYGPKAAAKVSIFSIVCNLFICMLFFLVSISPGHWGEYYANENLEIIDDALNKTLGGTWYVLFGSTFAMFVSSIVNSIVNYLVSRKLEKTNFKSFALRSYISTAVGQFVDNMIFSTVVSHVLFGWSWIQVFICAFTASCFELILEVVFSPIGYKMCLRWEKNGTGKEYIKYLNEKDAR